MLTALNMWFCLKDLKKTLLKVHHLQSARKSFPIPSFPESISNGNSQSQSDGSIGVRYHLTVVKMGGRKSECWPWVTKVGDSWESPKLFLIIISKIISLLFFYLYADLKLVTRWSLVWWLKLSFTSQGTAMASAVKQEAFVPFHLPRFFQLLIGPHRGELCSRWPI